MPTYNFIVAMMKKVALRSCFHVEAVRQNTECSVDCDGKGCSMRKVS